MATGPRSRMDPDGVRVVATASRGAASRYAGLGVALAALVLVWVAWRTVGADDPPVDEPARPRTADAEPAPGARDRTAPTSARAAAADPRQTRTANGTPAGVPRRVRQKHAAAGGPERELTFRDVQPFLGDGREGIGVFPPPGTDPPKRGIVVPEDFPLPEGYVRHHQATDDGTPLPPILMFHPDYEWVDEAGRPLPIPENRVVPPELAPPGLPIRMLDLPGADAGQDRGR